MTSAELLKAICTAGNHVNFVNNTNPLAQCDSLSTNFVKTKFWLTYLSKQRGCNESSLDSGLDEAETIARLVFTSRCLCQDV